MKLPTISIIVPVYNSELYLRDCLDSILGQSYTTFEVLIIDDGSTDQSPQICDEYMRKDKRVKVLHKKNGGVSSARNLGLELCAGEFLTFIDSDDWIDKDYCKILIEAIDENVDFVIARTISVATDNYKIDDGYGVKGNITLQTVTEKEQLYQSIFIDNPHIVTIPHVSTCSAKLFRTNLIREKSLKYCEQLSLYEDALFNMSMIHSARCVKILDSKIYFYRLHKNSSSNSFRIHVVDEYEAVYMALKDFEKQNGYDFTKYSSYFKIKNLNTMVINIVNSDMSFSKKNNMIRHICRLEPYRNASDSVGLSLLPKRRKLLVGLMRLRLYSFITVIYNIV